MVRERVVLAPVRRGHRKGAVVAVVVCIGIGLGFLAVLEIGSTRSISIVAWTLVLGMTITLAILLLVLRISPEGSSPTGMSPVDKGARCSTCGTRNNAEMENCVDCGERMPARKIRPTSSLEPTNVK